MWCKCAELLVKRHKWTPITIKLLAESGDSPEYRKYCADVERLYRGEIAPARFDIWHHETNAINSNSGIKFVNKSNFS